MQWRAPAWRSCYAKSRKPPTSPSLAVRIACLSTRSRARARCESADGPAFRYQPVRLPWARQCSPDSMAWNLRHSTRTLRSPQSRRERIQAEPHSRRPSSYKEARVRDELRGERGWRHCYCGGDPASILVCTRSSHPFAADNAPHSCRGNAPRGTRVLHRCRDLASAVELALRLPITPSRRDGALGIDGAR